MFAKCKFSWRYRRTRHYLHIYFFNYKKKCMSSWRRPSPAKTSSQAAPTTKSPNPVIRSLSQCNCFFMFNQVSMIFYHISLNNHSLSTDGVSLLYVSSVKILKKKKNLHLMRLINTVLMCEQSSALISDIYYDYETVTAAMKPNTDRV